MNKIVLAPTTVPGMPPLEYIAAAAEAGYDGVGMRLYAASASTPFVPIVGDAATMRDVKQAVAGSGLSVHDVFSCYLRPDTDFAGLDPVMDYAADIGARYAVVICDDPEWSRAVDNLGGLADLAAKHSLTAVVEGPIYGRAINTLPLVLKLVADAGRPNIVVCIDTYQLFRSGDSLDSLRAAPRALLPYLQLTDGLAEPVGFVVPGKGSVPLGDIMQVYGDEAVVGLECPAPSSSASPPAVWLRTVLEGARDVLSATTRA